MSLFLKRNVGNQGQALLIVLLTLSVVLTIVLSIVSRSITDISITSLEEDSQRAFNAAEAGVEQALLKGGAIAETDIDPNPNITTSFNTTVSALTPSGNEFVYPSDLLSGESGTFWFVSQDAFGVLTCSGFPCLRASQINVCWGTAGTPAGSTTTPAVEVFVFYDTTQAGVTSGDFSNANLARLAFDPNPVRIPNNNFAAAGGGCPITTRSFAFSTGNINLPSDMGISCATNRSGCLILAKVRMYYNHDPLSLEDFPHPVGIFVTPVGGTGLAAQGILIDSTGVSGESTRKVNVFQAYGEPPFVFDSAVFSSGDVSK